MSDGEITASAPNGEDSPPCREITVVDIAAMRPVKTTPFELPEGWTVKKVPRADGIREDKYFFEPGTGKKFYSARAVERYLTNVETPKQENRFEKYYKRRVRRKVLPLIADERYYPGPQNKSLSKALKKGSDAKSPRVRKSSSPAGKSMKLDNKKFAVTTHIEASASPFNLPDGWVVKAVPRRNKDYADKLYFEPGTGRRFQSLISVRRHLAEAEAEEDKPLAVMFNIGSPAKKLDPKMTNSEKKSTSPTSGPATPPDRIKWVLTDDTEGSIFRPFIGESMVAEPVVQRWTNRFTILINGENHTGTSSEC